MAGIATWALMFGVPGNDAAAQALIYALACEMNRSIAQGVTFDAWFDRCQTIKRPSSAVPVGHPLNAYLTRTAHETDLQEQ